MRLAMVTAAKAIGGPESPGKVRVPENLESTTGMARAVSMASRIPGMDSQTLSWIDGGQQTSAPGEGGSGSAGASGLPVAGCFLASHTHDEKTRIAGAEVVARTFRNLALRFVKALEKEPRADALNPPSEVQFT